MNSLPTDILNIIIDYKSQLEHKERFKNTLYYIKDCDYYMMMNFMTIKEITERHNWEHKCKNKK